MDNAMIQKKTKTKTMRKIIEKFSFSPSKIPNDTGNMEN